MKTPQLLLLMFASAVGGWAGDLSGDWHGAVLPEPWPSDQPISSYWFEGDHYRLSTTVTGYGPLESLVPESLRQEGSYEENGRFELVEGAGFSKMTFEATTGLTLKKRLNAFVAPRRLFLYEGDKSFFEPDENNSWHGYSPRVVAVRTSSRFQASGYAYDGDSFVRKPGVELVPWIEGAPGDGLGEWIELDIASPYDWVTSELLVGNGFQSFDHPGQFGGHNRVRGYRLTSAAWEKPIVGELLDSPGLQDISLPVGLGGELVTIRLTILSVYRGGDEQHTCLSLIYPLPPEPEHQFGPKY